MPPLGRRRLSRVLALAIIVAAVAVVVLLVLILGGVLVLSSNGPKPVTIDGVHLQIHEGNSSSGNPWFGPDSIYYGTANGYPLEVAPGASWVVAWFFVSVDPHYHNVTGVFPQGGFTRGTTSPALPYEVGPEDDGTLSIPILAPNTPGATYNLVTVIVVIDAVS